MITMVVWKSFFRAPHGVSSASKAGVEWFAGPTSVSLKIGRGGFMSSSGRIFAVVVLMLVLLMGRATPSAAQAHGSANAHPAAFATAAPADTGVQNLPITEPYNLSTSVLVTPLTSSPDYHPSFGGQAYGSAQEVVQPETRVQERTEDRIQPQSKIGE